MKSRNKMGKLDPSQKKKTEENFNLTSNQEQAFTKL